LPKDKKLKYNHNLYTGFWYIKQQVQYNCVDLFYNKDKKEFLHMLTSSRSTTENTRLLSARFFTQFIAKQLHKNSNLKENKSFSMSPSFSKGLYIGILQLIYSVIEPFKLNVNGIKIICSGK
jgi:exonuclease III